MKASHLAWLEAHPDRTAEWLKARTSDGFDVHHIDGDQENNSPDNLLLIECTDHMLLHNGHRLMNRLTAKKSKRKSGSDRTVFSLADRFGVSEDQIREWRAIKRHTAFMPVGDK